MMILSWAIWAVWLMYGFTGPQVNWLYSLHVNVNYSIPIVGLRSPKYYVKYIKYIKYIKPKKKSSNNKRKHSIL